MAMIVCGSRLIRRVNPTTTRQIYQSIQMRPRLPSFDTAHHGTTNAVDGDRIGIGSLEGQVDKADSMKLLVYR